MLKCEHFCLKGVAKAALAAGHGSLGMSLYALQRDLRQAAEPGIKNNGTWGLHVYAGLKNTPPSVSWVIFSYLYVIHISPMLCHASVFITSIPVNSHQWIKKWGSEISFFIGFVCVCLWIFLLYENPFFLLTAMPSVITLMGGKSKGLSNPSITINTCSSLPLPTWDSSAPPFLATSSCTQPCCMTWKHQCY